jgi:L-fucose isomerase-like protein
VLAAARCFATLKEPGAAATFSALCRAAVHERRGPAGDVAAGPGDEPPRVDTGICRKLLRKSTILVLGSPVAGTAAEVQQTIGTRVVSIGFPKLDAAYRAADRDEAAAVAERWIGRAESVVEPSPLEVRKSAALYLAMKKLMRLHHAQAIAVDCLSGFYSGQLAAYPCLGFAQFNDAGLVGACEADLKSTMTMLAMTYLVGRPGYISGPILDMAKHQVIYAHCCAPRKVYGPAGPTSAYQIRSHAEDHKGASVRSLLPLGRMTTTVHFDPTRKQILMHQGKAVANVDEERACRTKLAVTVRGDIDKLITCWDRSGWHRVTYYGDLHDPVHELADRIGFEVVPEA